MSFDHPATACKNPGTAAQRPEIQVGLKEMSPFLNALPCLSDLDLRFNPRIDDNILLIEPVLRRLEMLALSGTSVEGSLEDIIRPQKDSPCIQKLRLADSKITGTQ